MQQSYNTRAGMVAMGPATARALEFRLALLTGRHIGHLLSKDTVDMLQGVPRAGLHLRQCLAPLLVTGSGGAQWSCYAVLWCAGAWGGPPARLGAAHVSGQVTLPQLEFVPELLVL